MKGQQVIKIEVTGNKAKAIGPFPTKFIMHMSILSGRKNWNKEGVEFEATASNIRLLKETEFVFKWIDVKGALKDQEDFENDQAEEDNPQLWKKYTPAVPLYDHQKKALALSCDKAAYAYLLEMGLGKTAIAIANMGYLYMLKKVHAVLIVAPKGVHRQWTEQEIPKHLDKRIKYKTITWGDKVEKLSNGSSLLFFSINIDAIRTKRGFDAANEFLLTYKGRNAIIVDEGHLIKNGTADRTKAAFQLGSISTYRRLLTGTPIAKSIIDAWSQFKFLDERILGHRYMTSFRSRYCIMGGWENKEIVGQKNTDEFFRLIQPHSFRRTKVEVLNLPPKTYIQRQYEMSDETRRHYKSLQNTFMTMFDDGEIADVPNAAVCALRLQQVLCGFLPMEDGTLKEISHERIDALLEIVRQVKGQIVIWARFNEDIKRIEKALIKEFGKKCCKVYVGATKEKERAIIRAQFNRGEFDYLISNPQAGGTGNDLPGKDRSAIYYSYSHRSLDRWQSEDRIHRIGTTGTVNIFDLVAARSVDKGILANLRQKRDISSLTLDELRAIILGD